MPDRLSEIKGRWASVPEHGDIAWLVAEVERRDKDLETFDWLKKEYGRVCGMLQETCQKYKLGLGGEDVAELVVAEVERLKEELDACKWSRGD